MEIFFNTFLKILYDYPIKFYIFFKFEKNTFSKKILIFNRLWYDFEIFLKNDWTIL